MMHERDEGRAVGTFFVGYAPMPSPTDSAWVLRVDVLEACASAPVTFSLMIVGVVDR